MEYIEKNWKKLLTLLIVTMLVIGGAVWFFRWQQRQQVLPHPHHAFRLRFQKHVAATETHLRHCGPLPPLPVLAHHVRSTKYVMFTAESWKV